MNINHTSAPATRPTLDMTNLAKLSVIALAGLLAASCSKPAPETTAPDERSTSSAPKKVVQITGNDQMKYDITAFEAAPGQKVRLTLKNIGTMPKISMGHNLVVLKSGTNPQAFIEAGFTHAGTDYIAPETKSQIIAATKLLGPGESDTIVFFAPKVPGNYDYVCSFPGHYAIGMKGIMTVK